MSGQTGISDVSLTRRHNTRAVLAAVYQEPTNRTHLADIVGLSRVTVSHIVHDLLERKVFEARGNLLSIRRDHHLLGVDFISSTHADVYMYAPCIAGEKAVSEHIASIDAPTPEVLRHLSELTKETESVAVGLALPGRRDASGDWSSGSWGVKVTNDDIEALRASTGAVVVPRGAMKCYLTVAVMNTGLPNMIAMHRNHTRMGFGYALSMDDTYHSDLSHNVITPGHGYMCNECGRRGCVQSWVLNGSPEQAGISLAEILSVMTGTLMIPNIVVEGVDQETFGYLKERLSLRYRSSEAEEINIQRWTPDTGITPSLGAAFVAYYDWAVPSR